MFVHLKDQSTWTRRAVFQTPHLRSTPSVPTLPSPTTTTVRVFMSGLAHFAFPYLHISLVMFQSNLLHKTVKIYSKENKINIQGLLFRCHQKIKILLLIKAPEYRTVHFALLLQCINILKICKMDNRPVEKCCKRCINATKSICKKMRQRLMHQSEVKEQKLVYSSSWKSISFSQITQYH